MTELLPPPEQRAVFAAAVLALNATPGVDFVLTVSRTLARGRAAGAAAALGISAGCIVHALAAACGLAALLALVPAAFTAIQWAGAAYLVWLGIGLLQQARPARQAARRDAGALLTTVPAAASRWSDFRAGLLTNVLNPKVALFFVAFLPQFVPASSPDKTASLLLLGGWFVAQGLLFLLALVLAASWLGRLGAPPLVRRLLQATAGIAFFALALRLVRARPATP